MTTHEHNFDVVVIGGGLAGHCAALAAAECGASVALFEKMARPGGSTVLSAGSLAFAGTELQRAIGVEDSPAGLAEELMKIAGGKADPKLVQLYVEHQADTFDWLKAHGVVFHKVSLSSNMTVPRTHPTNSKQLIEALHERVRDTPSIHYQADTPAHRLLTNELREVIGCEIYVAGKPVAVRAKRGVVIASGGFTKNPELMQRFAPQFVTAPAWGGEGNTGDGLTLAWELGADLIDMGYITGTFGAALNNYPDTRVRPGDELMLRMAIYRGAIVVNLDAQRFADESQSYKKLGTICLAQRDGVAIQIFDQPIMDQSAPNPSVNDLQGALAKGVIRKAKTLQELAALMQLDASRLESTVARYNSFVDANHDADFGRTSLGGGFGKPVKIATPPYYALPCSTAVLSTYCGLHVDTDMRVLNVHGRPIAHLFAAGEVIGGLHAAGYMSGSSLGKAAIFGRIAGAQAAQGT